MVVISPWSLRRPHLPLLWCNVLDQGYAAGSERLSLIRSFCLSSAVAQRPCSCATEAKEDRRSREQCDLLRTIPGNTARKPNRRPRL